MTPDAREVAEMVAWLEAKIASLNAEASVWLHAGYASTYDALSREAELVRAIADRLRSMGGQ